MFPSHDPKSHPIQPKWSQTLDDAINATNDLALYFEYHVEPYTVVSVVKHDLQTNVITTRRKPGLLGAFKWFDSVDEKAWATRTPDLGSTRSWISVYVTVPAQLPVSKSVSSAVYSGTTWAALSPGDTITDMAGDLDSFERVLETVLIPVQGTVSMSVAERTRAEVKLSSGSLHRIDEVFVRAAAIVFDSILTDVTLVPGAVAQAVANMTVALYESLSHKLASNTPAPHDANLKNGYTLHSSSSSRTHVFHTVDNGNGWSDSFVKGVYDAVVAAGNASDTHYSKKSTVSDESVAIGEKITQHMRWKSTSTSAVLSVEDSLPSLIVTGKP